MTLIAQPLRVSRSGYGTTRLTGPEVWGEPANRLEALQILKTAVGAGVNFLDTADYYGEDVTNCLIAEALHPYPPDLVICTIGATRRPDKSWVAYYTPQHPRVSIENNLRLRQDQIQLVHFRVMSHSEVPFTEALGAMFEMQREGKILHVGLSNVSRAELEAGLALGAIATAENRYGYGQRTTHGETPGGEEVLDLCGPHRIPLIPFFSLLHSRSEEDAKIADVAKQHKASKAPLNLAWLLHKSPGFCRFSELHRWCICGKTCKRPISG